MVFFCWLQLAAVAALCVQYESEFRPSMSIVVKALSPLLQHKAQPPPAAASDAWPTHFNMDVKRVLRGHVLICPGVWVVLQHWEYYPCFTEFNNKIFPCGLDERCALLLHSLLVRTCEMRFVGDHLNMGICKICKCLDVSRFDIVILSS